MQAMSVKDMRLGIIINRREETALLTHRHDYVPPPDAQEKANIVVRALLDAEQKTGTAFHNKIFMETDNYSVAIEADTNRSSPQSKIFMGVKYLTDPHSWSKNEMEAVFLHEIGHEHYAPLMQKFGVESYVSGLIDDVKKIDKKFRADPEKTTAHIIKYYGGLDKFIEDIRRLHTIVKERYSAMNYDPLRNTSDAQVAAWLIDEHKSLLKKLRIGNSPLQIYAELPALSREVYDIEYRLEHCFSKEIDSKDIVGGRACTSEFRNALDEAMPLFIERRRSYNQLKRGEEFLCDDFSVIHSDEPSVPVDVMKKIDVQAKVSTKEPADYEHPSYHDRIARMSALAKRVETGRKMCGSLALAGNSSAPENDKSYSDWVRRMDVSSASRTPS